MGWSAPWCSCCGGGSRGGPRWAARSCSGSLSVPGSSSQSTLWAATAGQRPSGFLASRAAATVLSSASRPCSAERHGPKP
eukprot:10710510-Alexandrium_andersonii.AAC.1